MLAVDSEHIPAPNVGPTEEFEQEPSLTEADITPLKQQDKRKLLTPLNILIILAGLTLLGLGTYYLFSLSSGTDAKNKINESHDKIISYADSSSDKGGSNSGSTSSKSSNNNNKPNSKSQPASKGVISSNSKLSGSGGSGLPPGDDEDEDDENSRKGHKSISGGSSTDVDSEEQESEDDMSEEDENNEPIVWVNTKAPGTQQATPNVGSTRDGN